MFERNDVINSNNFSQIYFLKYFCLYKFHLNLKVLFSDKIVYFSANYTCFIYNNTHLSSKAIRIGCSEDVVPNFSFGNMGCIKKKVLINVCPKTSRFHVGRFG